mgnify:FL=1
MSETSILCDKQDVCASATLPALLLTLNCLRDVPFNVLSTSHFNSLPHTKLVAWRLGAYVLRVRGRALPCVSINGAISGFVGIFGVFGLLVWVLVN